MKKIIMFVALGMILNQAFALADISQVNDFFNEMKAGGTWSGTGTTTISSGKFAGTYDINVTWTLDQATDLSWSLTTFINGAPPQSSTSITRYAIVKNQDNSMCLQVSAGQYTSCANIAKISPSEMSFNTSHNDPVSGAEVTNIRDIVFNSTNELSVSATNLQRGSVFQTYSYKLHSSK